MEILDFKYILDVFFRLLPFIPTTLSMAIISMILGLIFGFILTIMKLSKNVFAKKISYGYTTIIRSTPTVVLLFLVFYGLPILLENAIGDINSWDKRIFTIIALSLFASATLSEIMRPSYEAINKGQYEAAVSVGLTNIQALREIVVPQALFIALPNLGNMFIALIHESALAYIIGTVDIMGQASIIGAISYGKNMTEIYLGASAIYWILSLLIGKGIDYLVSYMARSRLSV